MNRSLALALIAACSGSGGLSAQAVGISYVQGTGQMGESVFSIAPIVAFVYDVNGNPVANSPVTFTVTQGVPALINPVPVVVLSDANGMALSYIPAYYVDPSASFRLVEVDAQGVAGGPVKFLFTSLATTATVQVFQPSDPTGIVINTTAGALLKGAYQAGIFATDGPQQGQPIPNAGLRATTVPYLYVTNDAAISILVSPPDPRWPSASCINNTLSDSTGTATCDLQIGPRTGTIPLYMAVGEYRLMPVITLNVSPGAPSQLSIVSGAGQTGQPGQKLALPLEAMVTDSSGNPTPNVQVGWTVTAGSATIAANPAATDAKGIVSNTVTLGAIAGPVTIRAQISASVYADFHLVSAQVVSSLQVVSGDNQSAVTGTTFANPLVVQAADANGAGVAGVPVAFAITGGGSLSASTVQTDASGMARVTATAGSNPGPLMATASALGFQAVFANLTALMPGPQLTPAGIRNTATGQTGLTPCGLASLTGTALAPGVTGTIRLTDPNATTLGPVDWVLVNGVNAPVVSVSNVTLPDGSNRERIVVAAPCGTQTGLAEVDVSVLGQGVSVAGVEVDALQPGVFTVPDGAGDGLRIVWATHPDGTAVSLTSPAARGEIIRIFATGLGPVVAPATPGSSPQDYLVTNLILGIDNAGVPMVASGYLTSQPGVYFVDVAIPTTLVTGETSAAFVIGADPSGTGTNLIYSNTVSIPIRCTGC